MNKTLSIALAGFSFIIEEHAHIKLSDYLSALRNSLDSNEADEVMHDIEIRIVEIFKDTLGKREVINDADVERVITQIGKPEQIEEQEETYYSENNSKTYNSTKTSSKQLFRDSENQRIAGVCAGLGHFFGVSIPIMRAIWLGLAILGIFTAAISTTIILIAYFILWAVLPVAETASDFLKMKGRPVNFETLKEESGKIVKFANDSSKELGDLYDRNKPYINRTGNNIWNVIRTILGAFSIFIAALFILALFPVLGVIGVVDNFGIPEIDFYFEQDIQWLVRALIMVGVIFPALLFGILAVKLLSPKTKIRNLGYVLGALLIILIALGTMFGLNMAEKEMIYKGHKEETEDIAINNPSDSLYIALNKINISEKFLAYEDDIFSDKKTVFYKDSPI